MSLSSSSDTINALGIFGRMDAEHELLFNNLENRYSHFAHGRQEKGVFNHLSLVIANDVPVGQLPSYIDLLREMKPFLPFELRTSGVIVRDDQHLALQFDPAQTEPIRQLIERTLAHGVVTTHYTKVVWNVPAINQPHVRAELEKITEMVFHDFILVANVQDDAHTIYSSNRYQL